MPSTRRLAELLLDYGCLQEDVEVVAKSLALGSLDHLGEPDAGDIAFRHEARQEVQLAVGSPAAGRVEDAFGFELVPVLRSHDDAGAGKGERDGGEC